MRVLIAILSCHSLRHCEQSERDTWIAEIPAGVDYKFFLGNRAGIHDSALFPYEKDEVKLDVGDGWQDITKKSVAVFRWALEQRYDFLYKCDLDTLVRPKLLLSSGFEKFDYVGGQNCFFASGGSGYWLSQKAMEFVVNRPVTYGPEEDLHTFYALQENGVALHADKRYKYLPGDVMDDETISYHLTSIRSFGKVAYEPQWMYQTWEDQKNRTYKQYGQHTAPPPALMEEKRPLRFRRG
jgi:Galactosyltransferase